MFAGNDGNIVHFGTAYAAPLIAVERKKKVYTIIIKFECYREKIRDENEIDDTFAFAVPANRFWR